MGSEVIDEEAKVSLGQAVPINTHCFPESLGKAKACVLPFHQTALTGKCSQLGCAQLVPDPSCSILPLLS